VEDSGNGDPVFREVFQLLQYERGRVVGDLYPVDACHQLLADGPGQISVFREIGIGCGKGFEKEDRIEKDKIAYLVFFGLFLPRAGGRY